jgi:leucine dehydrogenase
VFNQEISDHPDFDRHERVEFLETQTLRAIIAVHNSNLGPAAGGCRIYPYSCADDALGDVLRLSKGMTYKSALAGLPLGGGKSIIIADPTSGKSRKLLLEMGEFVDSLNGQYLAAEDSGTTVSDIKIMAEKTKHVSGCSENETHGGDPSPVTAYGVFLGIQEAVRFKLNSDLKGVRVAIQGAGNVGYRLAHLLAAAGAKLIVADTERNRVSRLIDELGVADTSAAKIASQQVDVFAPCAMGAAINENSLDSLQASIVAGGANNQLANEELGQHMLERGILYAPDYVINAGGIIDIFYQQQAMRDTATVNKHVEKIVPMLGDIFVESGKQGIATNTIANEMAQAIFLGHSTKEAAA